MKKYIYCALMALLCLACSKEDDPSMDDTPIVIPKTLYAQAPVFESRALVEEQPISWDDSETVDSRTYAVEDEGGKTYTQYWSEQDLISVFFTNKMHKYILTDLKDEDGDGNVEKDYGIFQYVSGTTTNAMPLNTYYYAVYPYKNNTSINAMTGLITYNFPNTQHYNGDSYANGENGMIAREPQDEYDEKFYFYNFCSYLQLRLDDIRDENNNPKTVQQIVLAANNTNDKITGNATIKFDGDVPIVYNWKAGASNQIKLDCGGVTLSTPETRFWFVLPGNITFTKGFTVTVTFSDNSYINKSTSKEIFIKRSHIKPMETLGTGDEEEDDIIITEPIRYKYNDTTITEPYPIGSEFYDENGNKLTVHNQLYDAETQEWVVYLSGNLKTIGGNNFQNKSYDIEYIKVDVDTEDPIIIGDFAFYNSSADNIIINNDIETIGLSAIKESTIYHMYIDGDVSEIKGEAFAGCTNLQTVEATSIKKINDKAFYFCSSLTTLPMSSLEYIGANAFEECTSLGNTSQGAINLSSIISIEDGAFWGCDGLTRVDISEYCRMIGEGAFCNATNLETVYCYADIPPFIKTDNSDGSFVFDATSENLCIYIPYESYIDYTNPDYFINNSGYDSSIKATINWWYNEYEGFLNGVYFQSE